MNKLEQEAIDYLNEHRIPELINHLGSAVTFHQPDNLTQFLLEELIRRKQEGSECGMSIM